MSTPDTRKELRTKIAATIVVVVPLLCVIAAMVLLWGSLVTTRDVVMLVVFYTIAMLGITVGYHRMLTHQGFGAPSWLRAMLLIAGCMAFEGGPAQWTATHIKHHAFSDEEDDPHTPLAGFWHAHIGWIFQSRNFVPIEQYAPQLLTDPVTMFIERYWYVFAVSGIVLPMIIGGLLGGTLLAALTAGIWGGGVRIFLNTHVTYSVNSICHLFGQRTFETTDESRNHWVVGLLAFGEGWHNNHHAFPRNAFHGMRWWQFDFAGLLIRTLERFGLAWDVQRVATDTEVAQRTRMQAMREGVSDMRASVLESFTLMRKELAEFGERVMPEQLFTDEQWKQWEALRQDAVRRIDAMRDAVTHSTHLKRQKMLQYQREAQKMYEDCKARWMRLKGMATA